MLTLEEFADGIIQIDHRGNWDETRWQQLHTMLQQQFECHDESIFVLLNFSATTTLDPMAFGEMITDPIFDRAGLVVLVARRAHLKLAREILGTYPNRDRVQLRIMPRLEDAFRILLDKQTIAKLNGVEKYGS